MRASYPHRVITGFFNLVFPYRCIGCSKYLDYSYLCTKCQNALPIRKKMECIGCRRPTPDGRTCVFCRETYILDRLFVVSDFNDRVLSGAIKGMKYRFIPDLVSPLVTLARKHIQHLSSAKRISFVQENFLVVPVPLHKRRENWRGFNQSSLLAGAISKVYGLDCAEILSRVGYTPPQADIEAREVRLENVKNIFSCIDASVKNRKILLVDDVCTTGATLNECARVLKDAGAESVTALVIARG